MKEIVLMALGLILLGVGFSFLHLEMYSFLAPKYQRIENNIYHGSAQYDDGMIRDLENLQLQFKGTKSDDEREALRAVIMHRFSIYPRDRLSPSLRRFYDEVSK